MGGEDGMGVGWVSGRRWGKGPKKRPGKSWRKGGMGMRIGTGTYGFHLAQSLKRAYTRSARGSCCLLASCFATAASVMPRVRSVGLRQRRRSVEHHAGYVHGEWAWGMKTNCSNHVPWRQPLLLSACRYANVQGCRRRFGSCASDWRRLPSGWRRSRREALRRR